jgi:hypothetical protein
MLRVSKHGSRERNKTTIWVIATIWRSMLISCPLGLDDHVSLEGRKKKKKKTCLFIHSFTFVVGDNVELVSEF